MNSDIRVQISFSRHVKRKKLQSRLKAEGVLALIDLWIYAGENHPDGTLKGMTEEDIALSANWNGDPALFVSTLIEVGFIDQIEGVYLLHDWEENNPYAMHAPERKERAQKAAKARWGIADKCSVNANSIQDASLSNAPSPSPSPSPIPKNTPHTPRKRGIVYSDDFETFLKAYPKKSGSRKAAWDNWRKMNGDMPPISVILEAIKRQSEWRERAGPQDFRPEWKDPERWIKGKMWEAEVEPSTKKSGW